MADLKDLQNLKNLNYEEIAQTVLQKKELLSQVVVGTVSLLLLIVFVKGYFDRRQKYQEEIDQLNAKIEVIQIHDEGVSKIKSFLAAQPKALDDDHFSSLLAEYASQAQVSIVSFSPEGKQVEDMKDVLSGKVSVRAQTYKDFLSFLKLIESSPSALKVDSCNVSPKRQTGSNTNLGIEAQMQVSSVTIKNPKLKKVVEPEHHEE